MQGEFVGIDFPAAASNTPLWGVHLPTLQTKGDKLMHYDRIDYQTFSEELISLRREFHKYPENAWTEYRTTVRIIQELASLGIPFWYGRKIHTAGERNNLPAPEVDRLCIERAIRETGEEALIREMSSGYTGVVAFIEGNISGPTVAIRCDIDCNDLQEDLSSEHRPFREGFSSTHENLMHACGHDSHAAIGIGTARILHAYKDRLKGKVVLIFQPAEEGNRGAISMVGSGILKLVMEVVYHLERSARLSRILRSATKSILHLRVPLLMQGVHRKMVGTLWRRHVRHPWGFSASPGPATVGRVLM